MLRNLLAAAIRCVCGVRSIPDGACPRGAAIFFANHSSHLDFVTIWAALPGRIRDRVRPVAGRDYWEKTALRRRLAERVFNALLIERQHVTAANNPVAAMARALEEGNSLIVFPEGTRSRDGLVHEFKSGLYHLVRSCPDAPLYPLFLDNLNRILPKGDFVPVPLIANLSMGEALRIGESEEKAAFLTRTRRSILTLAGASYD